MKNCIVEGCGLSSKDITLFEFPTSRLQRRRWLDAINSDLKISADGAVCLRHFTADDYENVRGKTRLKAKVVPSVFKEQTKNGPNYDALGTDESQSTKDSDNHNGIDNVNENVTEDNDSVNNGVDNESLNNVDRDLDNVSKNCTESYSKTTNKNISKDNKMVTNNSITDNETVTENEKIDSNNGLVKITDEKNKVARDITDSNMDNTNNETVTGLISGSETASVTSNSEVDTSNIEAVTSNSKADTSNIEAVTSNSKTVTHNKDTNEEVTTSKGVTTNNETETSNNSNSKAVTSNNAKVTSNSVAVKAKRVKKKWVPMRKMPRRRMDLSEDSSDSVNSDIPAPPVLEDLEEQLPNYQIANMKTERQVAAMTLTEEPLEHTLVEQDVEEMIIEPHVPVFIELSVGQETIDGPEQNDCMMVMESVECDIDPTIMLQIHNEENVEQVLSEVRHELANTISTRLMPDNLARAEDEECCEQIDLDEDDDDEVMDTTGEIATPPSKNRSKKSRPTDDPISLLTSSDEDDVILQEPHIDTLSVSDATTDEDNLPLQKLIKREKITNKKKKEKSSEKSENYIDNYSVLVGVPDYYCYICKHTTTNNRKEHQKHMRKHERDRHEEDTAIYQTCKECGFTTASKTQLQRHSKKHISDKKYRCPLCTYRSKYNMSLLYHLKTHKPNPDMYNCGSCSTKLTSKRELLDHQIICPVLDVKYDCNKCNYVGRSKRELRVHNKFHKK